MISFKKAKVSAEVQRPPAEDKAAASAAASAAAVAQADEAARLAASAKAIAAAKGGKGKEGKERANAKERVKGQRLKGQAGIGDDFKVWKTDEEMVMRQGYD